MNTWQTKLCGLLWLLVMLVASPSWLLARQCGDPCEPAPCGPVTCCTLAPEVTTEYHTKVVTRYRPEVRERMVTVYRDVPTVTTIQEDYTVLLPEERTRTVVETINHRVYGDIELRTTAMTPEVDVHQGTYAVTRMVAVREERLARADGSLPSPAPGALPDPAPSDPPATSDRAAQVSAVGGACNACCDPCAPCKVCVTCWKPVTEQVTVQYPLTRFKPDSRFDTVSYYEYKPEIKLRKEPYLVQVPETRTRTRYINVMRTVAEQQPERYTVMVPYQERIQFPVETCRYVERTVIVR